MRTETGFDFHSISLYFHKAKSWIMEVGAHIVVKGFVQGVGFRYFVYHRAKALDLKGYVKNLYNGDVEIEVEGDRSLIEEFINQVKVGPRAAHISDMGITWKKLHRQFTDFDIQ